MEDSFELSVEHNNTKDLFTAALVVYGFTYRFNVDVNGQSVLFEPDEEGSYRAIINPDDSPQGKSIDVKLLQKIAEALEAIFK